MINTFRGRLLAGALAAVAAALSSCGPDDGQAGSLDHYSLGPTASWPMAALPGDPLAQQPMPDALPMVADAGLAPRAMEVSYRQSVPAPRYYDDGARYGDVPESYYERDPGVDAYGLLAMAASMGAVLGNAPPDYAFAYDDSRPWAWQTGDRWVRYAEPIDGGYRTYYYEPGRERPFLVRDPYYSYGYADDRLVGIYDRFGRVIDPTRAWEQRRVAQRYERRGYDIYRSGRESRRFGVDAQLWQRARAPFWQAQDSWERARQRQDGWRQWDQRHQEVIAARWTQERLARDRAAQRFGDWHNQGFWGTAPRFYEEAAADRRWRAQVRSARVAALHQDAVMRQRQQVRWAQQQRQAQLMQARHDVAMRQHMQQVQAAKVQQRAEQARRAQDVRAQQAQRQAQVAKAQQRAEHARRAQDVRAQQAQRQAQVAKAQQRAEHARRAQDVRAQQAQRQAQVAKAQQRAEHARRAQDVRAEQGQRRAQVARAQERAEQARRAQDVRAQQAQRQAQVAKAQQRAEQTRRPQDVRAQQAQRQAQAAERQAEARRRGPQAQRHEMAFGRPGQDAR